MTYRRRPLSRVAHSACQSVDCRRVKGKYVALVDPSEQLHIEVQAVTHESRGHLDIETDDMDAEVVRLEVLGATRVKQIHTWWVMQAPTGQRF